MSIDKVVAALNQNGQLSVNRILFAGEDNFAAKLTIGQILKAKVLRHHEGSRYVTSFGGQEKIVDSSIPLTPGELIEGRVKSLGKQVELQRINHLSRDRSDSHNTKQTEGIINNAFLRGQNKQLLEIQQFFADRNASLNAVELKLLSSFLPRSVPMDAFMLSALALKKSGIAFTRESIEEIGKALLKNPLDRPANASAVVSLNADFTSVQAPQSQVQTAKSLGHDLLHYTENFTDQLSMALNLGQGDTSDNNGRNLAAFHLLNIQDDSSVGHQLINFPIWLGDKLVDIQMAFFDQQQSSSAEISTGLPFKRFVFTLHLELLGEVVATAKVYGQHVHLVFITENLQSTDRLSDYMSALMDNIETMGWIVDKIEYQTRRETGFEPAVAAVVEHYISKNSISRVY